MRLTPRALTFGGPGLAIVGLIGWYAGSLLGLGGWRLWVFRAALWILGTLTIFLIYRLLPKKGKGPDAVAEDPEIAAILATASRRLKASGVAGKNGLRSLPAVLVLGPPRSAKTCVVQRAGVEIDLLAGDGDGGEPPPPTPNLNLWLSQNTILLEAGEGATQSSESWQRVLQGFKTKALPGLFKGQPSRIAIVCVGSEWLTGQDRQALATLAKDLRERLNEAAAALDTRLPVYVLFTKADEIQFFTEYVRNLNDGESTEPLGVTLPLPEGEDPGLYKQWQAKRLSDSFESVFLSLAQKRTHVMTRAGDPMERSSAYEFPRELRKIADKAEAFLLELTRPSQLRISSFLRGFYFTGIRPMAVDARPEPTVAPSMPQVSKGATMVFDSSGRAAEPQPQQRAGGRVAQWTFLGRLLPEVLLKDSLAVAASRGGPRMAVRKRILLGSVLGLIAGMGLLLTISFLGNRRLQDETLEVMQSAEGLRSSGFEIPSLDDFQELDLLRNQVEKLGTYQREGRPTRIGWGLYSGSSIFPHVRRFYFNRFRTVLFEPTRTNLLASLSNLSEESTQEEYEAKYRALKAYLLTTSFPDSTSGSFLSPVLVTEWLNGRDLEEERTGLARAQFDFYTFELPYGNPYGDAADNLTVERARAFLRANANEQSFYAAMLSQANSQFASVQFNRDYPGSGRYVVNTVEVPGAFTSGGWQFVLQGLESATDFFQRESWVVGPDFFTGIDPAAMATSLRARYQDEYIQTWRTYLSSARVANAGLNRAGGTLSELAGPRSPLFQMLDVASAHTEVDSILVGPSFQPLHVMSPPEVTDRLFGEASQPFLTELGRLAGAMGQLADDPGSSGAQDEASTAAQAASGEIDALRLSFNTSPEVALDVGSSIENLLRTPIRSARSAIGSSGAAAMASRGQQFCRTAGNVLQQFPFQVQGRDASLADIRALLHPDEGALWVLEDELQNEGLTPSAQFQQLVERARIISTAFYGHGGEDPRIRFRLRGQPTDQVPTITLNVDGDEEGYGRNDTRWGNFTWNAANAEEVELRVDVGGQGESMIHRGTWALFKFFHQASWQPSGNTWRLSWTLDDSGATVQADLDLAGAEPILRRGFFDGLSCPANVVQ